MEINILFEQKEVLGIIHSTDIVCLVMDATKFKSLKMEHALMWSTLLL